MPKGICRLAVNPRKGVVEVEVTVTNQKDKTVQSGYNRYLIGGAS